MRADPAQRLVDDRRRVGVRLAGDVVHIDARATPTVGLGEVPGNFISMAIDSFR